MKLYFGSPSAILSTLLILTGICYVVWAYRRKVPDSRWGMLILGLILLVGAFGFCANIRDLYHNSIVHAVDGSTADGLFSVGSAPSIVYWITGGLIWAAGIGSIFWRRHRKIIFTVIVILAGIQLVFMEGSRILLYLQSPDRFNYM